MKAFYVFVTCFVLLIIMGGIASFFQEKADFLIWMQEFRNPVADYYFFYVTRLGEYHAFVFFGLLLWIFSWRKMITVPILGLTTMLVSYVSKEIFQHERPSLYLERTGWDGPLSVMGYQVLSGFHSFPSGHSMAAWALFTLMAVHIRKVWFSILCIILATSVSLSRIYLMAHFLQDVVAGAMIGFSLAIGVYFTYRKWTHKPELHVANNASQEKALSKS
jgi:membrane-associated phospholipid phosphatase